MALAVCLLFDARSDLLIRELWSRLEDEGISTLATHTHRHHYPHLSYAVLRSWNLERAQQALAALPAAEPFMMSFHGTLAFPRGRVALAPAIGADVALRQWRIVTGANQRDDLHVGLYVMLPDDTCQLLAVDFDKTTWREDAQAYAQVCAEAGVPAAAEVSRSGNGAHVWTFFTAPVMGATARALGFSMLRAAMAFTGRVRLASYDRIFPAQDFLPSRAKGTHKFGNLIALPLDGACVPGGTTVFLDPTTMAPWPDQWAFLSSVARVSPATVDALGRLCREAGFRFVIDEQFICPTLVIRGREDSASRKPGSDPTPVQWYDAPPRVHHPRVTPHHTPHAFTATDSATSPRLRMPTPIRAMPSATRIIANGAKSLLKR